jgi:hypothetical protein
MLGIAAFGQLAFAQFPGLNLDAFLVYLAQQITIPVKSTISVKITLH